MAAVVERVERLNRASLRRVIEPDVDLPGAVGDGQLVADELLSVAGLDLGLALVREYRGATYAQGVQLLGEYDPRPDFPAEGNPATANPVMVKLLNDMHQPFIAQMGDAVRQARAATP